MISKNFKSYASLTFEQAQAKTADLLRYDSNNNFPLDFVQCFFFLFLKLLPTRTVLPCSVLILSMAKSDVENLVKN